MPHSHSIWVAMGLSLGKEEIQRRYAEVERRERLGAGWCCDDPGDRPEVGRVT